jgi:hypothetical protein
MAKLELRQLSLLALLRQEMLDHRQQLPMLATPQKQLLIL